MYKKLQKASFYFNKNSGKNPPGVRLYNKIVCVRVCVGAGGVHINTYIYRDDCLADQQTHTDQQILNELYQL